MRREGVSMDWVTELEACLPGGLYVHNLRRIVVACECGVKQEGHVLPAYVVRSVFADLQRDWEGRPILVEEARRIEGLLLPALKDVVEALRAGVLEAEMTERLARLVRAWLSV
jgi:hypothetical protein